MDIEMVMIQCAGCGMPFAITKDREERLRQCHNTFYCPAGHPQSFRGQTEEERLRKKVSQLEIEKRHAEERVAELSKKKKTPQKHAKKTTK